MRTSAPGTCDAGGRRGAGFTLLEVLVVVVILGLAAAIGFATLERDERGTLEREARRFAGALDYALRRAQWRHETLGVSAQDGALRFWQRGGDGRWHALTTDDALAARTLPPPVTAAALAHAGRAVPPDTVLPLRAGGRNDPFVFALRAGGFVATVATDPLDRVAIAGPHAP